MARFKTFFALCILGAVIFLSIKLVPPYFANYQLQDDLENMARFASYAQGKTDEDVRNDVLAKARERGVELTADQVQITKDYQGCNINVSYDVVIPVPGYTFRLKFNPKAGNRQITAK